MSFLSAGDRDLSSGSGNAGELSLNFFSAFEEEEKEVGKEGDGEEVGEETEGFEGKAEMFVVLRSP